MLVHDYLSLRRIRLEPSEDWTHNGDGLCFVFPNGGLGEGGTGPIRHRLEPGDVLVQNPAGGQHLSVRNGRGLTFWFFSVNCETLFPLFANSEMCLVQDIADGFRTARRYPAATPLARECHRLLAKVPLQLDLDHRGQLLRVAASILASEFNDLRRRRAGFVRADEHVTQVLEGLSVADITGLSVDELADRFGCSRRHLTRLFHQHFGCSVLALRTEMRLLRAVSLLRDPGAKIINVAAECGFNHLGLFNAVFKRRFGTSPGLWRKQVPQLQAGSKAPPHGTSDCRLRALSLCPWAVPDHNGHKALSPQEHYGEAFAASPANGKRPGLVSSHRPASACGMPGKRLLELNCASVFGS